jgi:S1-C subfamily serine protease
MAIALVLLAILAAGGIPSGAAAQAAPRCAEAIPDIFDRLSPAVVYVSATSINPYRLSDRVSHSVGSGFIIDRSGLVLTNSHVALGRQSIRVTLDDGTVLPARLAGADPLYDLALLQIPAPEDGRLPTAPLGDSDVLRVGEDVVAIGNPLGLDQTLTRGVVSAINRLLPNTPLSLLEPLIQTDTPINPGNSGGPLIDRCGEVVGINTAALLDAQSIGFAIPINLAKAVLPSLLAHGRLIRPWIGFHGPLVTMGLRDLLRIPLVEGLLVEVVEPGSPAEEVGLLGGRLEVVVDGREFLLGGDVVTELNGTPLTSPDRLLGVMKGLKVGDTVRLTIFRGGDYREMEYVLPERPLLPGDLPQGTVAPLAGDTRRPRRP